MKASEWRGTLPPGHGPARERAVRKAISDRHFIPPAWVEVALPEHNGHTGSVFVASDALHIGEPGDSVRVNVTHRTAQWIADQLGWVLPTSKIADVAYLASSRLTAQELPADSAMATTERMFEHSELVDAEAERRHATGLLAPGTGKMWVNTKRLEVEAGGLTKAANYGFYEPGASSKSPGGLPLHQNVGLRHGLGEEKPEGGDDGHIDYSQTMWFIRSDMMVDGVGRSVDSVVRDPELAGLISYDGPLRGMRHPGIPKFEDGDMMDDELTPIDLATPTIRLGDRGPVVMRWQAWLLRQGYGLGVGGADGVFGRKTQLATIGAQKQAGLTPDGIVGQMTWRLYKATPMPAPSLATFPFKQAKHYRRIVNLPRSIELIVIHSMEALERVTTAEACAGFFADPGMRNGKPIIASAHFCADVDSIVQCVKVTDIAYAAPGANHNGIHIELAGYARQKPEEWGDAYSDAMLRNVAKLVAALGRIHQIPMAFCDVADLVAKKRGVTTHHAVSLAFRKSDHTDPGEHFPVGYFLDLCRAA